MVNQTIKKSESTLAGITFSILIAIGIFTAMFLWVGINSQEAGISLNDPVYNESYTDLVESQNNLSNTITSFRDAARALTEPKEGFGISWNGLQGLLGVFLIPLQLIDIGINILNVMTSPLAPLLGEQSWILPLLQIGIVAFLIFIIVSIFKGDSNVIR